MPYLEKHLYIKKSLLPNAGKGLFTKKAIVKGTRIIEYKGRLQRWADVKDEDGYNPYLLQVNRRFAINTQHYLKALSRYVNDANGLSRIEGIKNNCEFVSDGNRCFIESKKNIDRFEEIFVGYGKEYWTLIRKIQRSEKAKSSPTPTSQRFK